jgi:hypothetical protein
MIRIKIIALFLGLLMTLQMLPISQIGQMLSSNQWIEELPHNANDNEGKAEGAIISNFFPQLENCNIVYVAQSKELAYLHLSDQIPSNHSSDVLAEPPNLLS